MLFPKPDPGVKSGLVAAHDGDETERARAQSDWWLISPMVLVTGVFLLLGAGIGIGVGIGAATWNKESAKAATLASTDLDTCPAAFSGPLTAVPALAKCSADYVSFQPSNTIPRVCLQYIDGKGPVSADNPVYPIWAAYEYPHPAKIALQLAVGSWTYLSTLGCPINIYVLNWVHALFPSIQDPPLACSADVEAALLLHTVVYDWEHAFRLAPEQDGGKGYKAVWASVGYNMEGADAGPALPMPTYAPTDHDIKKWYEKTIRGEGPEPYSVTNAAFTYAMTAISGLHMTFVADAMIRSKRLDANNATLTWSVNIVYSGPSTPPCNASMGPLPGFKHGSTVTIFGYEKDSELTAGQQNVSLQTFFKAQMTCATATTDGNSTVSPFYNIYEDQARQMPPFEEVLGFRNLPRMTAADFRAKAAASPAGSKMFYLG
jgi:hypothetical protein